MNVEQGWIEWNGGECPLPRGTLIKVQYADETRETAERLSTVRAEQFLRDRSLHESKVIAYRIVDPNKGDLEKGV